MAAMKLYRCQRCRSDLVCPLGWDELDADHWEIELRCGECGRRRTAVVTNAEAAAFEERLARQREAIEARVERLDRERMACEVESLAHAISLDLIDAADFAP